MTSGPASQEITFGRETLARMGRAIVTFGTSEVRGQALGFAGLLVALLLAMNGLNVVNSYVGRDFMTAIERRDWQGFLSEGALYLGVFAIITVAAVFYSFTEQRLGLLWREWITKRIVRVYLEDRLYYRMMVSGTLTNPDQRIADDVRTFTTQTLSLSLVFLNGVITIVAFSGVLWSISRLLFVAAAVYAGIGSVLAVYLGRSLVRLNYDQADREADFRSDLIHVRENAESVALFGREDHLRRRLLQRLDALVGNMRRIIAVNRNLGFFTTGYNNLIQVIPALIVAPLFIRGTADFGVISQSAMAFAYIVGAFSVVVTQFPSLSSYAAVLARLSPLAGLAEEPPPPPAGGITIAEDERRLALEHVTLRSPRDDAVLVSDLNVEVTPTARLLVTSASEHVTDVLQRAIAGIWEAGEGRIVRPPLNAVRFLPDREYLPPGTLRALITGDDEHVSDERIRQALRTTGAERVVERVGGLDVECDWDGALSVEEQRLLGLAHVLVASPRFAVVSHVDMGFGKAGATPVLDAFAAQGIGLVALGDGAVRHGDFDVVIDIGAGGSWTRTEARKAAP